MSDLIALTPERLAEIRSRCRIVHPGSRDGFCPYCALTDLLAELDAVAAKRAVTDDPMAELTRLTEDAGLYAERRGDLAAVEAVQIARFWRGLERYGDAVLARERMRMEQVADSRDVMALMKAVPDAAAELVKRHRHWIRRAQDAEVSA